jgi:hypothetical protein
LTSGKTAVARTLKRAAAKLGGVEALAARLSAPVSEVVRWIDGIPPAPDAMVFIAALDIVSAGP